MGLISKLLGRSEPVDADEAWTYPMDRSQDRRYPPDFTGVGYFWDIDKTYLVSEFDTLKGLLSMTMEMAIDKRNIAGTDVLLRALRRGHPDPDPGDVAGPPEVRSNPLYFVSASPPQLRGILEKKMLLDGVEYDGITFKDQLALVRQGRVGHVTAHIGYKLVALLLYRRELPWTMREVMVGDDSETDALIYGLYADIIAGRLRGDALTRTLARMDVPPEDTRQIRRLSDPLPARDLVDRIFINLEKRTAPSSFHDWGPRVAPCYDTFQMALGLYADRCIGREAVLTQGRELLGRFQARPAGLLRRALDLVDRGVIGLQTLSALWPDLRHDHIVPEYVDLVLPDSPTPNPKLPARDFVTPMRLLDL